MDRSLLLATYPNLEDTLTVLDALQVGGVAPKHIGAALADGYHPKVSDYVAERIPTVETDAMPGLGIVVTSGILTLTQTDSNMIGKLKSIGVPQIDAEAYTESLRRGDVLVAVQREAPAIAEAQQILYASAPINISNRVRQWRKNGWRGFDPMADPYTPQELRLRRLHENRQGLSMLNTASDTLVREYVNPS